MKKSSKEDLSVEIQFLECLRERLPGETEVLRVLADDYTKVGRWKEGLDADLELTRLNPNDPLVHYNLACSYSLLERLKESAQALARAIRLGYREWDRLQKDPDLKNLRKSPEFVLISTLIESQPSQKEPTL